MSIYQVSQIIHLLINLSDIIFSGLKVLVPLVLLLKYSRIKFTKFNLTILIISLNFLLLGGGLLFLTALLADAIKNLQSEDEAALSFMLSILTGPHWYQLGIPIIIYAIIPQVMWLRKARQQIVLSFGIILVWIFAQYLIEYLNDLEGIGFPGPVFEIRSLVIEYSWKTLIVSSLTALIYLFVSKRKK